MKSTHSDGGKKDNCNFPFYGKSSKRHTRVIWDGEKQNVSSTRVKLKPNVQLLLSQFTTIRTYAKCYSINIRVPISYHQCVVDQNLSFGHLWYKIHKSNEKFTVEKLSLLTK